MRWRAHAPSIGFFLLASTCLTPLSALAQNATWQPQLPASGNWDDPTSWSGGIVPAGTATFNGATPVNVTVPGVAVIETIRFGGSTPYTIDVFCGCGLFVTGAGILNQSSAQQTFNVNGGMLNFINSSTITGDVVINNSGDTVFGNIIPGFNDAASAGSATIINNAGGALVFASNSDAGTAQITNQSGAAIFIAERSSAANSTILNMSGGSVFVGFFPADTASAGNATITNDSGAAVEFNGFATAGHAKIFNSGNLNFFDNSTAGNATISVLSGGFVSFDDNSTGGRARFITDNDINSTVDFSWTLGTDGAGTVTAGSIEGGGTFVIGNNNLIVGSNNLSTTLTGMIDVCACGIFTKVGSGTMTFAPAADLSLFDGSLVVNGGTVVVDNDLSAATGATVNRGGTLAGGALVPSALPATWINGGTLSPGGHGATGAMVIVGGAENPATMAPGGLVFSGTGTFAVDVAPTGAAGLAPLGSSDLVFVVPNTGPGSATLAGTVQATGLGGPGYKIGTRYTVLAAQDGFSGSRFERIFVRGDFGSTRPVLAYDPSDQAAYIDLIQGAVSGQLVSGASINQINVARGIDNALLGGVNSFAAFTNLYNLTGNDFLNALDQLSGEVATGFQQAAYQSMGSFLNTLLNPFTGARSGFGPGLAYADADSLAYAPRRGVARQAQTAMASALPMKALVPDQRYAVWGAAFGGSNSIDADAVAGSHKTDVRAYGFALGADFRVTQDALLGFAVSGGRSSWGLAEGLGSGSADNFQTGVYGSLRFGAAYVSAALAYGAHWVDTKRNVSSPGIATLESDYNAHSFGGRIEGGYRFGEAFGITPYAALQGVAVRAPGYLETASSGAGALALQYDRASDGILRTELGAWADHAFTLDDALLTLRGRAAWAHDAGADRALGAFFPALPGSSFTVLGAAPGDNLALLTAGIELKYLNGVSLTARFDSELSDQSRSYGGTAAFRYVW